MAIDAGPTELRQAGQPSRGNIGQAVEASTGELPLTFPRLEIQPDGADSWPGPQQSERGLQRIVEKQHVGVEYKHEWRGPRGRPGIDARGEAAIASGPYDAAIAVQPGGERRIHRFAVVDDDDVVRFGDVVLPDGAEEPQTGVRRAVIDDYDIEILRRGHGVALRAACGGRVPAARFISAVRPASNRARAGSLARRMRSAWSRQAFVAASRSDRRSPITRAIRA